MVRSVRLGLCASLLLVLGACSTFTGAFTAEDNIEAARSASAPSGLNRQASHPKFCSCDTGTLDHYMPSRRTQNRRPFGCRASSMQCVGLPRFFKLMQISPRRLGPI